MKIVHIIYDDVNNPWVGGGGALRALEINRQLAGKNDITVITGNFPNAESGVIDDIKYVRLGKKTNYLLSRISFTLSLPFQLKNYDCEIIVNDFSAFSPCFCYLYTKKPVVNTFYHKLGKQAIKKFSVLGYFALLFEKFFLATARNIITISPSVTEIIKNEKKDQNIQCIYTGVDENLFDNGYENGGYVAFLGRIDIHMKGLDNLIKAFSAVQDASVTLKIAGSGPEKNVNVLRSLIESHNLESRVTLIGKISDTEKKSFLKKSKFVVMPSRFEGWGIVAIEAAACSKPVIGTNIPGLKDAIVDKKTGFLVEPENIDQLAEKIQTLWSDESLCADIGKNGKDWAANFKWDAISKKQEDFYNSVAALN